MKRKFVIIILFETAVLLLIILFAMLQKAEADKSQARAEEFRIIAEENRNRGEIGIDEVEKYKLQALQAREEADRQRAIAVQNEQMAMQSKQEAEKQKELALANEQRAQEARMIAETERRRAEENAKEAIRQIEKLTKELEALKKTN